MARPTLLSDAVMQSIADFVASGGRPERVRISTRSVRSWRAQGRPELDALSLEARLVLALDRAEEEVRALSWQETARRLDEEFGEDWMPIDFELSTRFARSRTAHAKNVPAAHGADSHHAVEWGRTLAPLAFAGPSLELRS